MQNLSKRIERLEAAAPKGRPTVVWGWEKTQAEVASEVAGLAQIGQTAVVVTWQRSAA